jgi:hypothetical protein
LPEWTERIEARLSCYCSKLEISNSRKSPQVVAVEPWGEDFTLLPGEELVILAFGELEMPWFHVVEWDGTSQVYCEATSAFKVTQGSRELECGHNRQCNSAL